MLMLTSLKASCTWEINGGAETRPIKMIKSTENDQTKQISTSALNTVSLADLT